MLTARIEPTRLLRSKEAVVMLQMVERSEDLQFGYDLQASGAIEGTWCLKSCFPV
jgi:hypothetical protein